MTRKLCALLVLASISGPAWSQTIGGSVSTGSPRYSGHLFKSDTLIEPQPSQRCLVRKKTGRVECRTMAQWRRLAKKIEEAANRNPG
jgi:hypothetical protein